MAVVCAVAWAVVMCGAAGSAGRAYGQTAELKAKVEAALTPFAEELAAKPLDAGTISDLLTDYLKKNPFVYGTAFAFAPAEKDGKAVKLSPYVYRKGDQFIRKDWEVAGDEYTEAEWYAEPVKQKKPYWSKPYFDKYGGEINMITFSVPIYTKDAEPKLIGVVTSDVPVEGK